MIAMPQTPRARFVALVDQKVAEGMSRVQAILAVGREHPDLYRQQLIVKEDAPPPQPTADPAREAWERTIAAHMQRGDNRVQAIQKAMHAAGRAGHR